MAVSQPKINHTHNCHVQKRRNHKHNYGSGHLPPTCTPSLRAFSRHVWDRWQPTIQIVDAKGKCRLAVQKVVECAINMYVVITGIREQTKGYKPPIISVHMRKLKTCVTQWMFLDGQER